MSDAMNKITYLGLGGIDQSDFSGLTVIKLFASGDLPTNPRIFIRKYILDCAEMFTDRFQIETKEKKINDVLFMDRGRQFLDIVFDDGDVLSFSYRNVLTLDENIVAID